MKDNYLIWNILSLLGVATGIIGLLISESLVIGLGILVSYLLYRKSVKVARLNGRTSLSKILHPLTANMIEFGGIAVAFFFTEPAAVVFALSAVGFRESLMSKIDRNLNNSVSELLGRNERVILLGLVFIAAYVNVYALLYGIILVGFIGLVETFRQLFLLVKKEV